jgi:hypothetical protein
MKLKELIYEMDVYFINGDDLIRNLCVSSIPPFDPKHLTTSKYKEIGIKNICSVFRDNNYYENGFY